MKTREMPPDSPKAITLRQGSVSVRIYPTTNRIYRTDPVSGQRVLKSEHPQFVVSYYLGSKRVLKKFADLARAKSEAELALVKLANGETEVLKLTGADRAAYVQAVKSLRSWRQDAELHLAVRDYVKAVSQLPPEVTLGEVVADYLRRFQAVREPRTVPELVTEFIEAKETAGRSRRHLADLRSRLGAFARAFQLPVTQITGFMIQNYIDHLNVANRTRVNFLRHITTLLRFAVRRKYASRDLLTELEGIEKPEVTPSETLIYTPAELREMLHALRPELVPWLAVAAFAGVRTAEILRLDWRDVRLDRRSVEVTALNAKTGARRLVPLCDAAIAWLRPHARESGRLACYAQENKFQKAVLSDVNRARREAGIKEPFCWKRNGVRHSWCSYRLAATQDAPQTALEAGNSPAMIFRHYRELVTQDEAREWFGVSPIAGAANVLPMTATVPTESQQSHAEAAY